MDVRTALAGVSHAASNGFPLVMLAGASESFQQNMGAFQELDQVGLLKGESKCVCMTLRRLVSLLSCLLHLGSHPVPRLSARRQRPSSRHSGRRSTEGLDRRTSISCALSSHLPTY